MYKLFFMFYVLCFSFCTIYVNAVNEEYDILEESEYIDEPQFTYEDLTPFYVPSFTDETVVELLNRVYQLQLTYVSIPALERNIFELQEQINFYKMASFINESEQEDYYARKQLAQSRVDHQLQVMEYISDFVEAYHEALRFTNLQTILETRGEMLRVLTEHGLTYDNHQFQLVDIMEPRVIDIQHMDISELTEQLDLASSQILTIAQDQDFGEIPTTWPVQGRITDGYGFRIDPFTKQLEVHAGIDIGAPIGTPVYAWFNGTVIEASYHFLFGNQIIIEQGEMKVRYAHLDTIGVSLDQYIKQGQLIGTVGSTGRSTGPHLHLGFYLQGFAVNPEYIFIRR